MIDLYSGTNATKAIRYSCLSMDSKRPANSTGKQETIKKRMKLSDCHLECFETTWCNYWNHIRVGANQCELMEEAGNVTETVGEKWMTGPKKC